MRRRATAFGQMGESVIDVIIKKMRFRHILPEIKPGSIVVDLGCGYHGEMLRYLAPYITQGIGIDLSVAKKHPAENIKLVVGRVDARLPAKSHRADYVTALAIIEHVDYPDILLREVYRILKPGGILLMTTPSAASKSILEFMAFKLKIIRQDEIADHKRYYTKQSLTKALLGAGFDAKNIVVKPFELGMNLLLKAVK